MTGRVANDALLGELTLRAAQGERVSWTPQTWLTALVWAAYTGQEELAVGAMTGADVQMVLSEQRTVRGLSVLDVLPFTMPGTQLARQRETAAELRSRVRRICGAVLTRDPRALHAGVPLAPELRAHLRVDGPWLLQHVGEAPTYRHAGALLWAVGVPTLDTQTIDHVLAHVTPVSPSTLWPWEALYTAPALSPTARADAVRHATADGFITPSHPAARLLERADLTEDERDLLVAAMPSLWASAPMRPERVDAILARTPHGVPTELLRNGRLAVGDGERVLARLETLGDDDAWDVVLNAVARALNECPHPTWIQAALRAASRRPVLDCAEAGMLLQRALALGDVTLSPRPRP